MIYIIFALVMGYITGMAIAYYVSKRHDSELKCYVTRIEQIISNNAVFFDEATPFEEIHEFTMKLSNQRVKDLWEEYYALSHKVNKLLD